MKAALLALMISILSILPAQAMTFSELTEARPGGSIINSGPCRLTDEDDPETEAKMYFCVQFQLDDQRYLAVLDAPNPDANIVRMLTTDQENYPDGKIPVEDLIRAGSI